MKLFISKILFFLTITILIAVPLDIFISNKLKQLAEFPCENEVWNDIYNSNINVDIAICGSSRAWIHFNPNTIEDLLSVNCYNLGEDGSNLMLQYLRYKEYIKYNFTPKMIVLSVDMWTFGKHNDTYPSNLFYPYMFWNLNAFYTLKSNEKKINKSDFFLPLIRYFKSKQLLESLIKPTKEPYIKDFNIIIDLNDEGFLRHKGYRGIDLKWIDDSYAELKDYEISIDSTLIVLMDRFIWEVQQDGIDMILVYSPEYKEGQYTVKNRNEIMSIYKDYSTKYNIPFYDYSDSLISKRKDFFYNVQHLNKDGSEAFTKKFVSDLKHTHSN